MMKNCLTPPITLMLAGIILLASCSTPKLYVESVPNSPLLEKKGDFESSIWMNPSGEDFSYEFQGAYAVNDLVVTTLNTAFLSTEQDNTHTLIEGGVGLYRSFWPTNTGWNLGRAELLANYGIGWAKFQSENQHYTGQYQRFSIQPAFGFVSRHLELSLGTRIGFVSFTDFKHYEGSELIDTREFKFSTIGPFLQFGFGVQHFKLFTQFSFIDVKSGKQNYLKVVGDDYLPPLDVSDLSIGIVLNLNLLSKNSLSKE